MKITGELEHLCYDDKLRVGFVQPEEGKTFKYIKCQHQAQHQAQHCQPDEGGDCAALLCLAPVLLCSALLCVGAASPHVLGAALGATM